MVRRFDSMWSGEDMYERKIEKEKKNFSNDLVGRSANKTRVVGISHP